MGDIEKIIELCAQFKSELQQPGYPAELEWAVQQLREAIMTFEMVHKLRVEGQPFRLDGNNVAIVNAAIRAALEMGSYVQVRRRHHR